MAYPSLPATSYLHPSPNQRPHSHSSTSASSVEPITPELTPVPTAALMSEIIDEAIECKWKGCTHHATSADALYDHLCNQHVGRKSTNNLCLTCGWEGCGVKCVKRDHITSHLRVHTPLKPHPCSVCDKTFKRPQDLKKHERIHTQEHHNVHKLSKAATSSDPAFNERVTPNDRGGPGAHEYSRSPSSSSLSPSSSIYPSSPYDHLMPPAHAVQKSVSPTPSALAALHRKQHEELAVYQQREMAMLQQLVVQQQQNQLYAARLAEDGLGMRSGQKRDFEGDDGSSFEGFLADMKKRKVEPVYDAGMIDRLNSLGDPSMPNGFPTLPSLGYDNYLNPSENNSPYQSYPSNTAGNFTDNNHDIQHNSMGIPEIRTEADLAMFNQFMISLGRDTANSTNGIPNNNGSTVPMTQTGSFSSSGTTDSPLSEQSPIEDLFNPEELASLGLTGIPGVSGVGNGSLNNDLPGSLPHQSISFGGVYPTLDNSAFNRVRANSVSDVTDNSRRQIAGLPRNNSVQSNLNMKSTCTSNGYGLGSMNYSELPPLEPHSAYGLGSGEQNYASFDSLARSRHSIPAATLAPKDFYKKTYRHVAPLGASIASRNQTSAERSILEPEAMDEQPTPKIPVRDLLISDEEVEPSLRLPQLHRANSREGGPTLPSIHDIRPPSPARDPVHVPIKRQTEDEIVRGVKRLELADRSGSSAVTGVTSLGVPLRGDRTDGLVRRRHALMIRSWLVAVNLEWRKRRLEELQLSLPEDELASEAEEDELRGLEEGELTPGPIHRRLSVAA